VVLTNKKDYPGAAAAFEEAIRLNSEYVEAFAKLGYTYAFLGDLSKAKEAFHKEANDIIRLAEVEGLGAPFFSEGEMYSDEMSRLASKLSCSIV